MISKTRQQQKSEDTRGRILDAAEKLFFEYGYARVTVDDICREIGLTKGAFYHHFSGKEAVYQQVYIPHLDRYLEEHYQIPDTASFSERLYALAKCTFESSKEVGKELVGQSTIGMLSNKDSRLFIEDRPHTKILSEVYKAGIAENAIRIQTTEEEFFMLYSCLMVGLLTKWAATETESLDWDTLLEKEISLLIK